MTDERDDVFEQALGRAAREIRVPPPTPRDEIWARIEAVRRPAHVVPLHRIRRTWGWWAVAAAAALAIGIGIGRWSAAGPEADAGQPVATAVRPEDTAPVAPRPDGPPVTPEGTPADEPGPATPQVEPGLAGPEGAVAAAPLRRAPVRRAPAAREREPEREAPAVRSPADASELYRLASVQMLGQAEALLTSFGSGSGAAPDPQLARWSRDVLASTRLLLDSPAAAEPRTRRLLEDLELVLVQIVQLSDGGSTAGDREHIEQTMESRDVLPRLRTAIPSGPPVLGI